jgi:hypothetical protein
MLLVAHCGFHHDKKFPWFKCCQKHVFQDKCFCSWWKTLNHQKKKLKRKVNLCSLSKTLNHEKKLKLKVVMGTMRLHKFTMMLLMSQYGFHHGNNIHDPIIHTIRSKLCTYHSILATFTSYIIFRNFEILKKKIQRAKFCEGEILNLQEYFIFLKWEFQN